MLFSSFTQSFKFLVFFYFRSSSLQLSEYRTKKAHLEYIARDLFLIMDRIDCASYADDDKSYSLGSTIDELI